MKRTIHALCAFATMAAMLALTGCGDSTEVAQVKALPFDYLVNENKSPNLTVDQVLDTRKICDKVTWETLQTDRKQTVVQYTCSYRGVDDSAILEHDKATAKLVNEIYQWSFGAEGRPAMNYAAITIHYKDGTSKDFTPNGFTPELRVQALQEFAVANQVEDFDHAWSVLMHVPLLIKPIAEITDKTYGNKLAALYPLASPKDAAIMANQWHGMAQGGAIGFDSLGYLQFNYGEDATRLFFVDPADVQIAVNLDENNASYKANRQKEQLYRALIRMIPANKLFCINGACFDNSGGMVGRPTPEVMSGEKDFTTVIKPYDPIAEEYKRAGTDFATGDIRTDNEIERVLNTTTYGNQFNPLQCNMAYLSLIAKQHRAAGQAVGVNEISSEAGKICAQARSDNSFDLQAMKAKIAEIKFEPGTNPTLITGHALSVVGKSEPNTEGDWPTTTPCIQAMTDAYVRGRDAQHLDAAVSVDQANDFASTCKAKGQ